MYMLSRFCESAGHSVNRCKEASYGTLHVGVSIALCTKSKQTAGHGN